MPSMSRNTVGLSGLSLCQSLAMNQKMLGRPLFPNSRTVQSNGTSPKPS
jgi:hypothetical protein